MVTLPGSVTRFYGTSMYALDVLENHQITFVRVTLLNDPFDPYGFYETDFNGYIGLSQHIQTNHPQDRGWFRAAVTSQSWGEAGRSVRAYMETLRRDTFVLCTSAADHGVHPRDNLYMWGHYGCGHRGLAIEFNTAAVASAVLKHNAIEGGAPLVDEQPWFQIRYAESFRPISAEDVFEFLKQEHEIDTRRRTQREETSLDRYYLELAVIKSTVWQAEKEWRLSWRGKTEANNVYKMPITSDCIKAVYVGLAASNEDVTRVVNSIAQNFPQTEIWRATKRHGDLGSGPIN